MWIEPELHLLLRFLLFPAQNTLYQGGDVMASKFKRNGRALSIPAGLGIDK